MTPSRPVALTIAGSDSSGGAGIQADIKTFSALGVYGATVVTALTAQNTRGVSGILPTPPEFVTAQIAAVCSDLPVRATKTGMLANAAIIEAVAAGVARHGLSQLVVDPVMVATSGASLIDEAAIDALCSRLIPLTTLITPNLPEAARLLHQLPARSEAEMEAQGRQLQARFAAQAVLIKGGHGEGAEAVDILLPAAGAQAIRLSLPRIETAATHGTGCTLAAAITAGLATGLALPEAVRRGKAFVWKALSTGRSIKAGQALGPVDHLFSIVPPLYE